MAAPSSSQLQRHIRRASLDTLNILFSRHAKARMRERHVTPGMIYEVLQQGMIRRPPEPDIRYPGLRCQMQRMVCGVNLAVVVYVDMPSPDVLVVTVYDVSGD